MAAAELSQITDLHGLAATVRGQIEQLMRERLGSEAVDYDFYREWNGGWRVRVTVRGPISGTMDFVLLRTPQGALLPLPPNMPERWRVGYGGVPASDGSLWTLDEQGTICPGSAPQ
jgi:hypothetical protein